MTSPSTYSRIAQRIRVPLGFVLAVVYLWLAQPSWISILAGVIVMTPGVWLRAIAAGHVRKNQELTTSGPYAYTRNPLYLGSILIAAGFGIASQNPWIAIVIVALFLAIYLPVILSEEKYLRSSFPGFDEYAQQVPRLFPRFSAGAYDRGAFSRDKYLGHREYNALVGSMLMLLALVVKLLLISKAWSFASAS